MNLQDAEPALRPRKVGEVILAAEGVSLSFGGVKALSDVSFDVREHEIRAIIGPNGAGKSSMLNASTASTARRRARSPTWARSTA